MDVINVEKRNDQVKANQLRRSGLVPCCVYGGDLHQSISIQMDQQTAHRLFRKKREGSKLTLSLDGKQIPVQIKEKKMDTVRGIVEHFSFQALTADQKVNSVAHILVKNTDTIPGVLERMLFEVPFASLPGDMIDTVTIDLEGIPVGTLLTLDDIPEFQDERVEVKLPGDTIVLRINDKKRAATPYGE